MQQLHAALIAAAECQGQLCGVGVRECPHRAIAHGDSVDASSLRGELERHIKGGGATVLVMPIVDPLIMDVGGPGTPRQSVANAEEEPKTPGGSPTGPLSVSQVEHYMLQASPVLEAFGNAKTIRASVPLANMFQYVSTLRSISKGRASYSMKLASYDFVPPNVEKELMAKFQPAEED